MYTLALFHCAELLNEDGRVRAEVYTQNGQEWDSQNVTVDRDAILRRDSHAKNYLWAGPFVLYTPLDNLDISAQEFLSIFSTMMEICEDLQREVASNTLYLSQKCRLAGFNSLESAYNCIALPDVTKSHAENVAAAFNTLLPFGL